jgi:RNA polymerase sigma-70 factor (ECF subfamily)
VSVTPPAAGFRDIYARYCGDVHRFALYLTGDPALAEDLTSEAFLRIWQAGSGASSVKGYLFAIVRNLYLHELRRSRRLAAIPDDLVTARSLETEVADRQVLQRTLVRLQQLSESDRAALLMRAGDGLPYEEIARLLGTTVGAAKVKVHRARLKLARTSQAEGICKLPVKS